MSLSKIPSAWDMVTRNAPAGRKPRRVKVTMQIVKRSTGESAKLVDVRRAQRERGIHTPANPSARKRSVSWED